MKPTRLPTLSRHLFLYDRKPGRIRAVLLAVALGMLMASILCHWAELQGV